MTNTSIDNNDVFDADSLDELDDIASIRPAEDATTWIRPERGDETTHIRPIEKTVDQKSLNDSDGLSFADIDWGTPDEELINAFASEDDKEEQFYEEGIEPIPDLEDATSLLRKSDATSETTVLGNGQKTVAVDESSPQLDESLETAVGNDTQTEATKDRGAIEVEDETKKRRKKTPFVIGGAIALALVLFAAFGLPAIQDYRESQIDVPYFVEYVDTNTGKAIANPIEAMAKNRETVTVDAQKLTGYRFAKGTLSKDGETLEKGKNAKSFDITLEANTEQRAVFEYSKIVSYTVKYQDSDGNSIADAKTVKKKLSGSEVTEEAPGIDGYTLSSDKSQTLKLTNSEKKNVITFKYTKDPEPEPEPEPVYEAPAYTYTPSTGGSGGGNKGSGGKSGSVDGKWGGNK